MKLYLHPMSSNARRAHMAAVALGLEPELITIDLAKAEQKKPEYLALNPNGKVPTLVDGDVVVWESMAIMTYLADKTPGQALYPTDAAGRTRVNQWLFWTSNHWSPSIGTLTYENFLKKMFGQGDGNEYAVSRGMANVKEYATTLDAHLAKNKYVAGDRMTLADLAVVAPLMYTVPAKLPVEGFANIGRWFGEMKQTDAWKRTEPTT
jgi:glutathione S-transferase